MKLLVILGSVFVLTAICLLGLTAPVARNLSNCFDKYNISLTSSLETARNEKWSKERLCLNGKNIINTQLSCYKEVEGAMGPFRTSLTWNISKIIKPSSKDIDEKGLIKLQNNGCKEFPETLIQ